MQATAQAQAQDTVTEVQSLALVKNVLRVGVSTICFIRGLFPGNNYMIRDYAEMKVQQLDPTKHKDVALLSKWLEEGVFDALSKRYLKTFAFTLGRDLDSPEEVVYEVYQWDFDYPDSKTFSLNGIRLCENKTELKQMVVVLIRSLMQFGETLDRLPNERWISARLTYHDDVTPPNYEPAFFKACDPVVLESSTSGKTGLKIKLGGLATPHLKMALKFFAPMAEGIPLRGAPKCTAGKTSASSRHDDADDDDDATVCSRDSDMTLTAQNGMTGLRIVSKDSSYGQGTAGSGTDDDGHVIVEATSLAHLDKIRDYVLRNPKQLSVATASKALNIMPAYVLSCFKRLASPENGHKPLLAECLGPDGKVAYKLSNKETGDGDETASVASTAVMEAEAGHEEHKHISPAGNVRRKRLHTDLAKAGFEVSLSQETSKKGVKSSTIAHPIIQKKARLA